MDLMFQVFIANVMSLINECATLWTLIFMQQCIMGVGTIMLLVTLLHPTACLALAEHQGYSKPQKSWF